jgi:hypothetical protein
MTTLREAAQQALDAWQIATYGHPSHHKATLLAITALRAALAQEGPEHQPGCALLKIPSRDCDCRQKEEPVAWIHKLHYLLGHAENMPPADRALALGWEPLYTTPPRREWRGLSKEEINALPEVGGRMWNMGNADAVLRAIRAVEAKLKEKNNG